jgi:hypothetical protein
MGTAELRKDPAHARAILCRDLVINSVLARIAQARVRREVRLRADALSKHPPPYRFALGQYHDARIVAVMNAYEEVFALPEPERLDSVDLETVSLATAMVRFRKILLVDAAQRAIDGDARTSMRIDRGFSEGFFQAQGVSVEEVAILALVSDLLVAEVDHAALDTKTRTLLLGSESFVKRRITDQSTLADLVKLYDETSRTIFGVWTASQHPEVKTDEATQEQPKKRGSRVERPRPAIEMMDLTDSELLDAREILDLLRRYRQKLGRARQPSRQRSQRTRPIRRR